METRQAESMMRTMDIAEIDLSDEVLRDVQDIFIVKSKIIILLFLFYIQKFTINLLYIYTSSKLYYNIFK